MTSNHLALPASSLRRVLIALATFSLLAVTLAVPVLGAKGGNAAASAACENGGYLNWERADGTAFKNEGACVKYAAMGNALVAVAPPAPNLTLSPGEEVTGTPYLKNYDFGLIAGVTQRFTVTNSGTAPSQLLFLSAPPPAFGGSDPFCAGQVLAPNDTCTFDVTFTPPACNAGDQFSGQFNVLGIDPATGTPDDRYIRLNVDGSCPSPFSISYSGQGTFSYNLTATGLVPGSQFQIFFHYNGQSLHEVGSANGSGVVDFFDTGICTFAGPSDPLLGVAAVGSPAGGAPGSVFGLPLPDATICPPPV